LDGFRVAVTDVDVDGVRHVHEDLDAAARSATWAALDVTDGGACGRVVTDLLARWGRLDAVVHSAGVTHRVAPTWELEFSEWQHSVGTNLTGTFNVFRAVAPVMLAAGYGRIVAIASIAGKDGNPNNAAYSAAKAGVMALVKSMGKELARTGVLVNAIAPAMIDTPILATVEPRQLEELAGRIPMGRIGRPEEVAALASWLVSRECSFSTGAVFDISGGRATY
jgi:3-oxoacyl-[acyl-carrier protein] reductase